MDRPATELDLYRELEGERALSDQLAVALNRVTDFLVCSGKDFDDKATEQLALKASYALASYNKSRGK